MKETNGGRDAKMKEMILSGEIKDAKTQAAVLKAALMLGY